MGRGSTKTTESYYAHIRSGNAVAELERAFISSARTGVSGGSG